MGFQQVRQVHSDSTQLRHGLLVFADLIQGQTIIIPGTDVVYIPVHVSAQEHCCSLKIPYLQVAPPQPVARNPGLRCVCQPQLQHIHRLRPASLGDEDVGGEFIGQGIFRVQSIGRLELHQGRVGLVGLEKDHAQLKVILGGRTVQGQGLGIARLGQFQCLQVVQDIAEGEVCLPTGRVQLQAVFQVIDSPQQVAGPMLGKTEFPVKGRVFWLNFQRLTVPDGGQAVIPLRSGNAGQQVITLHAFRLTFKDVLELRRG
ncbi:hypothetical protein ES703_96270 [subsurface metagenome]